jgi:hypothetical protein
MPYGLKKSPGKNLYWVYNKNTGRKYSKRPIPLERAQRQRRAIYASENGYSLRRRLRGGNSSPCVNVPWNEKVSLGTVYSTKGAELLQRLVNNAYGELQLYHNIPVSQRTPDVEKAGDKIKCYIEQAEEKLRDYNKFVRDRLSRGLPVAGGRSRRRS